MKKGYVERRNESIAWLLLMLTFAMPFITIMVSGRCKDLFDYTYCILMTGVMLSLAYMIADDMYNEYKRYKRMT